MAFVERATTVDHYPNLKLSPPPGYADPDNQGYQAYIAAPVVAGGRTHGMLLVESLKAGSLRLTDEGLVGLLAGMLGAGRAVVLQPPHPGPALGNTETSSGHDASTDHTNGVVGSAVDLPTPNHGLEGTSHGAGNVG